MIIGIDPGPTDMAVVAINDDKKIIIADHITTISLFDLEISHFPKDCLIAIEDYVIYQPVGQAGRDTIKMIGAIRYLCDKHKRPFVEIPRGDILRHICGATKGGDTALRAAVMDRYGGSRKAAWGTKKDKGPLYGLTGSHLLAALGVAITADETRKQWEDKE